MKAFRMIAVTPCAALLMAVAALVSCGKDPGTESGTTSRGLSMQLSGDASLGTGVVATFDTPKQVTLSILARLPWSLSVDADWVKPSKTSGVVSSRSVDVVFAIDKNEGDTSRVATVTITTSEEQPYIFTITQHAENVLSGVNEWMYEELGRYYYWSDAVQAIAPPKNSLGHSEFLTSLIESLPWSAVQDTSNGESPATIDGHWNDSNTAREHIYSYVERVSLSSRAGGTTQQTFGMGVIPFIDGDNSNRFVFLVTWVREGSPAAKAGLERGMWITKFNKQPISDYRTPYVQIATGSGTLNLSTSTGIDRTITAAQMDIQPILNKKVFSSPGGRRVAYMLYNGFEADVNATSEQNDRFLTEMRAAFAEFKAGGATEMVLDLRYNPGGYVRACQVLSSLISGAGRDKVFVKMLRNKNFGSKTNPEVLNFTGEGNALGLGKLYVLVTVDSASASEMVINALRGIDFEVVVVGERTNGKNVGMDYFTTTDASGKYEMWPITFKALNAKDFCDYAGGFDPDYEISETEGASQRGEKLLPLGDPGEVLLKAALTLIDGGKPDIRRTRSASATALRAIPAPPTTRGGAKYIPETE